MPANPHGGVFPPGLATGIGSLPFTDAAEAAALVLAGAPRPAGGAPAPRSPREGVVAQWAGALPEVTVAPDGSLVIDDALRRRTRRRRSFTDEAHAGLLAFLDATAAHETAITARQGAGRRTAHARRRARSRRACRSRSRSDRAQLAVARVARGASTSSSRPACRGVRPLRVPRRARARAVAARRRADRARGRRSTSCRRASRPARSRPACTSAATATCGSRSRPAPPCSALPVSDALDRRRRTRWCATSTPTAGSPGARCPPTVPIGESPDPLWRRLVTLWCELTRRGCEPAPAPHPGDHHAGVRARRRTARRRPNARCGSRPTIAGPRRRPGVAARLTVGA